MVQALRRLPFVISHSGQARSTLYLRVSQGLWPKPVKIGKAVGWPEDEIVAMNAARIAGKSDEEIKALVVGLEAARKNVPNKEEPMEYQVIGPLPSGYYAVAYRTPGCKSYTPVCECRTAQQADEVAERLNAKPASREAVSNNRALDSTANEGNSNA